MPPAGSLAPAHADSASVSTSATRIDGMAFRRDTAPAGSRSATVRRRFQRADVRQVPVLLGVVEPVADDELVRDVEAHVTHVEWHLLDALLAKQRRNLERRGLATGEVLEQVL